MLWYQVDTPFSNIKLTSWCKPKLHSVATIVIRPIIPLVFGNKDVFYACQRRRTAWNLVRRRPGKHRQDLHTWQRHHHNHSSRSSNHDNTQHVYGIPLCVNNIRFDVRAQHCTYSKIWVDIIISYAPIDQLIRQCVFSIYSGSDKKKWTSTAVVIHRLRRHTKRKDEMVRAVVNMNKSMKWSRFKVHVKANDLFSVVRSSCVMRDAE